MWLVVCSWVRRRLELRSCFFSLILSVARVRGYTIVWWRVSWRQTWIWEGCFFLKWCYLAARLFSQVHTWINTFCAISTTFSSIPFKTVYFIFCLHAIRVWRSFVKWSSQTFSTSERYQDSHRRPPGAPLFHLDRGVHLGFPCNLQEHVGVAQRLQRDRSVGVSC